MPVRSVVVDTSALYALADSDDVHHLEAVAYLKRVGRGVSLVLAEPTLMETMTLLSSRLGKQAALRALGSIREDYQEMWRIF